MIKTFLKLCAVSVVTLMLGAGCASTPNSESTGEYLDSAAITAKVKAELALSGDTSALEIEVETFRDTVQLSGFVDSEEEKAAAEKIAKDVVGVKKVDNALLVKS